MMTSQAILTEVARRDAIESQIVTNQPVLIVTSVGPNGHQDGRAGNSTLLPSQIAATPSQSLRNRCRCPVCHKGQSSNMESEEPDLLVVPVTPTVTSSHGTSQSVVIARRMVTIWS